LRRKRWEITIKIPPMARQDIDRFLEKLSKALYGETVIGSIEGDTIRLYVYGSKLAKARTVRLIRKLMHEYSSPKGQHSMRRYSIQLLNREAGTALAPELFVEILKLYGYTAEWNGSDAIMTSAPPDVVFELAKLLANAIKSLANVYATRSVKRVLTGLLAIDPSLTPQIAVRMVVEEGAAKYDDEGKLVPAADWREALKKLGHRLYGGAVRSGDG